MKKLFKVLTIVGFMSFLAPFALGDTVNVINSHQSNGTLFTVVQNDLWVHGVDVLTAEQESDIQKKINDINNISAADFYPEELTQPLNKI